MHAAIHVWVAVINSGIYIKYLIVRIFHGTKFLQKALGFSHYIFHEIQADDNQKIKLSQLYFPAREFLAEFVKF